MRTGNILAQIKARVDLGAYDLATAEGRADLDDALRAELAKIDDDAVRSHAGEMIRDWRRVLFAQVAA